MSLYNDDAKWGDYLGLTFIFAIRDIKVCNASIVEDMR